MKKLDLTLQQILAVMEIQKETWERRREVNKDDLCLLVSISDVTEDIITIKRAIRIKNNYEQKLDSM